MAPFLECNSWFDKEFKSRSHERYYTFKIALNLLYQQKSHNIVETGCTRRKDDYGNGNSTFIFSKFINTYGGHLTTIDIDIFHIASCMEITMEFAKDITYLIEDSLIALPELDKPIDLLYLDSLDVPEGDATECQEHNLKEFKAVEHLMHPGSLVLIDDNDMENGGKSKLTKAYLASKGWKLLLNLSQSLWLT